MKAYINKAFLFLILSLALTSKISGKSLILRDLTVASTFNQQGDLIYIYKNIDRKIRLETLEFQTEESFARTLPLGEKAFSPVIKKDSMGQIWLAWEEWESDHSKIFLGRLEEDKIIHSQLISEEGGHNLCPDLCFDLNNNPWLVWINYKDAQYRVFVHDTLLKNTWVVNFPLLSSAFGPQIAIDLNHHVWVFWSGKDKREEQIYYSIFDQYTWSPIRKITRENKFPQINPSITIDTKGFIWITWSGYDGQDYEIYCKFWDGEKWSENIDITNNHQRDDSFPSVSISSNNVLIVAWSQSGKEGSHIYFKYLENESWSERIKISQTQGQNIFPRIAVEGEKIGIVWQFQNEIKSKFIFFNQWPEKKSLGASPFQARLIYNPSLDEDKYICFGDSITYGYIHYEAAPEKSYPPRLEMLLDQNFGSTEVVNEGWPGEITQNGLGRIENVIRNHMGRYLLLMEGTNDIIFKRISIDTTVFNLKQMVKRCIDFGVFPAIATIIPRNDWKWRNKFFRNRIFYLNEKIRELANNFPIPLVDQFDLFYSYPEEKGGWESLLSDYNHPSEEGYQLMAEEWFEEIKNFPFPPIHIRVKRTYNEILFFRELGNAISWDDNLKIFDMNEIEAYKIYRKRAEEGNNLFKIIQIIHGKRNYFDKDIDPSDQYVYVISTLRKDKVEGPCSVPKQDH